MPGSACTHHRREGPAGRCLADGAAARRAGPGPTYGAADPRWRAVCTVMDTPTAPGRLLLIPAPLSSAAPEAVLPARVLEATRRLRVFVVENGKTARQVLKWLHHPGPLAELQMTTLDEHTRAAEIPALLSPLAAGRDMGLMSEAGCPGVADPGAVLVRAAHEAGYVVEPAVGPSALLLALMASGLNGQRFAFHGYLPIPSDARCASLVALERRSARDGETQIWIETPYRNDALFRDVVAALQPTTRVCVASGLTGPDEQIQTRSVAAWRRAPPVIGKAPTVFLLLSCA